MDLNGRRESDNIEDVRGQSDGGPIGRGGGFGIPGGIPLGGFSFRTIIIFAVIYFVAKLFFGVDLLQILSGEPGGHVGSSYNQSQSSSNSTAQNDEMKKFVSIVLADTEDTWTGIFESMGKTYERPKLVMYSGQWRSACGEANSAVGPFYCPTDRKVYLDTDFFREMQQKFKAGGDFADAYVIAHEVGHHVQNLLGILPKFNQARAKMSETQANAMSVRVELQADCFAGIWGKFTQQKGILQSGDLEEALNAAHQIGDDALQKQGQGYVVPDSFTHGTSAQRMKWFQRGFDTGKLSACDTFSGAI
ncbi:MAG TPA: neutral zinc metallopeptidase [Ensifer sp.]|nr:neutral zinc metallopeptidase [Ensifer sp.]